jgi:RNA polymerase sigma-70 factor, ECF subfamily
MEMGALKPGKGWKGDSNLFPDERYSLATSIRSGVQCEHGIARLGGPHKESMMDELALLERFLRGRSEVAFRALYRAHTPALYALALRLTGGDRGEAEDLVQESWVRALTALRTFRAQSTLRSWLCGVLVNVRRGRIRAEWRIVDAPEVEPIAERTDPDDAIDLEREIAALPEGARDVYVLHDVYGYTHREIAELLGVIEGTSKSQLNRARCLLRISLL